MHVNPFSCALASYGLISSLVLANRGRYIWFGGGWVYSGRPAHSPWLTSKIILIKMMGRLILTALIVASTVLGSPELLERNFAYRSPYANQPGLSLDTHSIHKRQFQAGEQIRREHHHLARKRDTTDRDDQGHPMPEGEDGTYLYTGVSAQIANHGNAPYVYAGELNFTHSVASGESSSCLASQS